MAENTVAPTPLPYGKLSPNFTLESAPGTTVSREQFRGKQGLLILFLRDLPLALLERIQTDGAEYEELNAAVLIIGPWATADRPSLVQKHNIPFAVLSDPSHRAWKAYTGLEAYGYGVFVLDIYGGVDAQCVTDSAETLPDAPRILQWVMGAQYRCNI